MTQLPTDPTGTKEAEGDPSAPQAVDFRNLTKAQIAAAFNKDLKTITKWQNEGLPFTPQKGKGKSNLYNLPLCIEWYMRKHTKGGLSLEEERAKQAREQTEMTRLKRATLTGNLISVEQAKAVCQRAASAIRQKIVTANIPQIDRQAILVEIRSLREVEFEKGTDMTDEDGDGGE